MLVNMKGVLADAAKGDKVMFHDIAVCATDAVCEDVKRVMRLFKPGVE